MKLLNKIKKLGLGASVFASTAVAAFADPTAITNTSSISDVEGNISGVYSSGAKILYLGAAVVGLMFVAAGLMKLKAHSHDMQGTSGHAKGAAMLLIVGSCLIAIPVIMLVGTNSFFGNQGVKLVQESSVLAS